MAELFDSLWAATPVLRTFVQYLAAFCSRSETVSDVISGVVVRSYAVKSVGMDVLVKSGDSRSNSSRDNGAAHFVMGDGRTLTPRPTDAGHHIRKNSVLPENANKQHMRTRRPGLNL